MSSPVRSAHRVAVLLVPEVVAFDALIPVQVLGSATDESGAPLYEVSLVSIDGAAVAGTHGASIAVHGGSELLTVADTVIVPGTHHVLARRHGTLSADLAATLATLRADQRLVSICTGAFVLAAAGHLDGIRATTHWAHARELARLHPRVRVDAHLLYADHGHVLTSGGLTAGIDLCLHLIRRDHGAAAANRAARYHLVPAWRDGGQAQFIEAPVPSAGPASTAEAQNWALRHLDQAIELRELADRAHMSVRTFNRRFRAETGTTPGAWLRRERLRRAQVLLESTDLPITVVATRAGFGSVATLRAHMQTATGISPMTHRRSFAMASPTGNRESILLARNDPHEPISPG